MLHTIPRLSILASLLMFSPAGPLAAQEADTSLLEEVQQRQKIAAQALEEDARAKLIQADVLRNKPEEALKILDTLRQKLREDTVLSDRKKNSLLFAIDRRVRKAEANVQAGRARQQMQRSEFARERRTKNRDDDTILRGLAAIRRLRQDGSMREAYRLAEELALRFPDNALVQQVLQSSATSRELDASNDIIIDKQQRTNAALRDLDASANLIVGNIEYSPTFLETSARRREKYAAGLYRFSEKEKRILRSLKSETSQAYSLQRISFNEAIELLRQELGQPLVIDKAALDELSIDYEVPVDVTGPRGITKRTLLRKTLGSIGLAYIVRDEALEVTSLQRAQSQMVVRYYPLDDLLPVIPPSTLPPSNFDVALSRQHNRALYGNGIIVGAQPFLRDQIVNQPPARPVVQQPNVDNFVRDLISTIEKTVDPSTWQRNGGQGSISYHAPSKTLIIKNSAEVHNSIGSTSLK